MSIFIPETPKPVYTFRVNNLVNSTVLLTNKQPDSNINNIIKQMEEAVVWIEEVPRPLKHGDTFTLSGPQAIKVKNTYLTISLELIDLPDVEGLTFEQTEDTTIVSWTANDTYLTSLQFSQDGGNTWAYSLVYNINVDSATFNFTGDNVVFRAKHANLEGAYSPNFVFYPLTPIVTTDDLTMHLPLNADVEGTIVNQGSSPVEEYGVVWATHDNPTIEDHKVVEDTGSFTGSFTTHVTGLSPTTIYFAAYATNGEGTSYGQVLSDEALMCLAEGTHIATPYGQMKIEDVTYDNELIAWNFDAGRFTQAKPVWIIKPFKASKYSIAKFSDGSELRTIADGKGHRIFNMQESMFTYVMNSPIGTSTFRKDGEVITLVSRETVEKETTFYNVITHTHMNVFANNILTSTGLNNIYPIQNMQFVKDNRILRHKEEFNADSLFAGLRLDEQPAGYPNLVAKIDVMKAKQL
jgi:hypothetical protein